ncbi:MAG: hypothetical protein GEU75_11360 [Dehalococcoidia bacterium]|nr:hypothetical protein [Dehalococcoidia bacterium]
MKLTIPAFGLMLGFLFGHGVAVSLDLYVLLGAIVLSHVAIGAVELRNIVVRSARGGLQSPSSSSPHA